jgi:6-phosphogluconolactonase
MLKNLSIFDTLDELSTAAAEEILRIAKSSTDERGSFRVALAGGSTARHLYQTLADTQYHSWTNWAAWSVYWCDERLVPVSHPDSNYGMARKLLLAHVPIDEANIYPVPVSLGDGWLIADEYEHTLRETTGTPTNGVPTLDLVLLGLGRDGHTASLFPGNPAVNETECLVVETAPGVLPPLVERITATLPLLNAARNIAILADGDDKAEAFRSAYHGVPLGEVAQVPAYLVRPDDGNVHWFITRDTASKCSAW